MSFTTEKTGGGTRLVLCVMAAQERAILRGSFYASSTNMRALLLLPIPGISEVCLGMKSETNWK